MTFMFSPQTTNIQLSPAEALEKAVVDAIDIGLRQNRNSQPRRQYIGASRIGEDCARMLAYEYHQTPKDEGSDFKGTTLRMFDMGHDGEDRMAEYLRLAGFDLHTHKEDGKQFGMSDAEGKFKGHLDGVIHGGPAIPGLKYPCLWENKAVGDNTWKKYKKLGIKVGRPTYYAQVQIYMSYFDLDYCLFTFINRDTCEIAVEVIPLNTVDAQKYIDKAVSIVKSQNAEEFSRVGKGMDDYACKFCDFKRKCYGIPVIQQPTPASQDWGWPGKAT
jgi:hypothetical protein